MLVLNWSQFWTHVSFELILWKMSDWLRSKVDYCNRSLGSLVRPMKLVCSLQRLCCLLLNVSTLSGMWINEDARINSRLAAWKRSVQILQKSLLLSYTEKLNNLMHAYPSQCRHDSNTGIPSSELHAQVRALDTRPDRPISVMVGTNQYIFSSSIARQATGLVCLTPITCASN